MRRLFLFSFFFASLAVLALDRDKGKTHKTDPGGSYVEAMVTIGNNNCGYLLRLSDGQLIRPTNLPKKFQHYDTKVLVMYDGAKEITDSPCDVQKEVNLTDIRTYKAKSKAQGKF
ncbi:MAG: hypothetical protein K0S33_3077 [Bacteroidetes bacterium]|jgi:hypothetical protein|nr:hypothetical protein [Bacteroidota bacterium]